MKSIHTSVLLNEVIEGLNLSDQAVVIDGTFGGGGHSREICNRYPGVKIIAIDQDKGALERGKGVMQGCDVTFLNRNFREIPDTPADAIILDLGLSSDQLENSGRGFSFMKDEPLLMTMKVNPSPEDVTAREVVNTWEEKSLADIIYGYGEEKLARKIARAIVEARARAEIKTTFDLVEIIESAVGRAYKGKRIHPATKTFQALRIAVNDELGALTAGLTKGFEVLKPKGRMAVISFHSLEDRVVKRFYKAKEKEGQAVLINNKVIIASSEEVNKNIRSRSAKLRILSRR
mgnify:CR=1 FL=1